MSPSGVRSARTAGSVNVLWGAFLLLTGDLLWRDLARNRPSAVELGTVRVLGTRHLGQGLAQLLAPAALPRTWPLVDLGHAASLLPVLVLDPARRRPAAVSAAVSLAAALLSAPAALDATRQAAARSARRPRPVARRARR